MSDGFDLTGQGSQISFELATCEMYSVDIVKHGEAVPKYQRTDTLKSEYIRKLIAAPPPDSK